jgi:small multidrug resistance pump
MILRAIGPALRLAILCAALRQKLRKYMNWLYLAIAIVLEVIATSALKASDGFTRLLPSMVVVVGYATAFYTLSLTLRTMPVGVVYAVWSGVGVVLITLVGWLWFKQELDIPAFIGIGLIAAGVIVLNFFSKAVLH